MVHNWAWYAVGINDYSKVLIIHKNMACCGFVGSAERVQRVPVPAKQRQRTRQSRAINRSLRKWIPRASRVHSMPCNTKGVMTKRLAE